MTCRGNEVIMRKRFVAALMVVLLLGPSFTAAAEMTGEIGNSCGPEDSVYDVRRGFDVNLDNGVWASFIWPSENQLWVNIKDWMDGLFGKKTSDASGYKKIADFVPFRQPIKLSNVTKCEPKSRLHCAGNYGGTITFNDTSDGLIRGSIEDEDHQHYDFSVKPNENSAVCD
jgi:hypothetical protein